MAKTRLTREDWLIKGLAVLQEDGAAALRAESLARALGTTKGSFYWHFKDVPEFLGALLDLWQQEALTRLVSHMESHSAPAAALRSLPALSDGPADRAIRAWAQSDSSVARIVAALDEKRLAHIAQLLRRAGVPNPDLARALYAALLGLDALGGEDSTALPTLVDLILALR